MDLADWRALVGRRGQLEQLYSFQCDRARSGRKDLSSVRTVGVESPLSQPSQRGLPGHGNYLVVGKEGREGERLGHEFTRRNAQPGRPEFGLFRGSSDEGVKPCELVH